MHGETTVPGYYNEPLVTSHKNCDSENHCTEFLFKVRKMTKNEITFIQSGIVSITKNEERNCFMLCNNWSGGQSIGYLKFNKQQAIHEESQKRNFLRC